MDRIVFKKEIDGIYEKLYSINEGLSSEDSKELIRGFNDGIKEGYQLFNENLDNLNEWNPFKAVAKAAGAVSGAVGGAAKGIYNQGVKAAGAVGNAASAAGSAIGSAAGKVAGAVSGAYQQGKQLAGKVWASVAEFATGVIKKITDGINAAASWMEKQPGKIKEYLTGVYNGVVTDMESAYQSLKDKATELVTSIQNIWTTVINNIKAAITLAKTTLTKTEESAKQWYEINKPLVIAQAEEWKRDAVEAGITAALWMKQAAETVLSITAQVASGAVSALKWIGIGCFVLIAGPIILLVKGIQKIPDLYAAAKTQVEAGITKLGQDWEEAGQEFNAAKDAGFNKGLGATTPVGKVLQRDPATGQMLPYKENNIFKFSEFVNEKKSKEEFFKKLK